VVEQGATDKISVLIALHLEAAAVDDKLGALAFASIDIAAHFLVVLLGNQRTISASGSVPGPILSARTFGSSFAISASAV
jgi:hypothetical protein